MASAAVFSSFSTVALSGPRTGEGILEVLKPLVEDLQMGEEEIAQHLAPFSEGEIFRPVFPLNANILHQASEFKNLRLLSVLKERFGNLGKYMCQDELRETPLHKTRIFRHCEGIVQTVKFLLPFCSLSVHQSKNLFGYTPLEAFVRPSRFKTEKDPACVEASELIKKDRQAKGDGKRLALLATAMSAGPASGDPATTPLQRCTVHPLFEPKVLTLVKPYLSF